MYLCLISTHELLLPAAIIFSQMKRMKKGVNIKFIPIFFSDPGDSTEHKYTSE